jgi:serine O-acetyltransferase
MSTRVKSLDNPALADYIARQLNHFFPDADVVTAKEMLLYIDGVEERAFACFTGIRKKYFNEGEQIKFSHLQSDQYSMYLYMLANHIHRTAGNTSITTKLYCLNKALHSIDIYFTSQMPDIFLLVHPLGTIMGRATFGDYFVAYQGCTIGCLNEGLFPTIGEHVIMYAHSSILGKCTIGSRVCIAAGVSVINTDIPDDVIVFGEYPNYRFAPNRKDFWSRPPFYYDIYDTASK